MIARFVNKMCKTIYCLVTCDFLLNSKCSLHWAGRIYAKCMLYVFVLLGSFCSKHLFDLVTFGGSCIKGIGKAKPHF